MAVKNVARRIKSKRRRSDALIGGKFGGLYPPLRSRYYCWRSGARTSAQCPADSAGVSTDGELVKVSHTEDGNVNASREKICGEVNVFCTLTFVKAD